MLLLPSSWGLTTTAKRKADALADAGFTVLVPDLNDGVVAQDPAHARQLLLDADMNVAASLVQSSLRLLQAAAADPVAPVGLVGYAAGASWALWLSVRHAERCAAVATYCGTQSISFDDATASYLLHFAQDDLDVTDDEIALMGLNLQLAHRAFHVEIHAGVGAGFAEAHHPDFDATVEAHAWEQTVAFLTSQLL